MALVNGRDIEERGTLLKVVDKLIKEGRYPEALQALEKARADEPKNPYVKAYEERVRFLIHARERLGGGNGSGGAAPAGAQATGRGTSDDQRRVAILSKISTFLTHANDFLTKGEFDRALEEIARANVLDPQNSDIKRLEEKVRRAKEDTLRREEEERQRVVRERERERELKFREELSRLQKDQEQKRQQDEKARKVAQQQKLGECLKKSRSLLAAGRLKEAQAELAFALVLEPSNAEARAVEQEIARRHEEILRAELERRRKEEEERRRAQERQRVEIQRLVEAANYAAANAQFPEALKLITQAYGMDPMSDLVQGAEERILASREEWTRKKEQERIARERELQQKREDEQRRRELEERDALIRARKQEAEARRKADEEEIQRHLARARDHMDARRYEQALAEVALAFVIDPFSEDVKTFEQQVIQAQETSRVEPAPEPEPEPPSPRVAERAAEGSDIASLLIKANDHAARNDFTRAFDLISRAYAVNPLDETIQICEKNIQGAFILYQRSGDESRAQASAGPDTGGSTSPEAVPGTAAQEEQETKPAALGVLAGRFLKLFKGFKAKSAVAVGAIAVPLAGTIIYLLTSGGQYSANAEIPPAISSQAAQPAKAQATPLEQPALEPAAQERQSAFEISIPATIEPPGAKSTQTQASPRQTEEVKADTTNAEPPPENPEVAPDRMNVQSPPVRREAVNPDPAKPTITAKAPEIRRIEQPRVPQGLSGEAAVGEVVVRVEVGPDGRALQAVVVKSTNPALNQPSIQAVMKSEFIPGITEWGSTTTWLTVPFKFR